MRTIAASILVGFLMWSVLDVQAALAITNNKQYETDSHRHKEGSHDEKDREAENENPSQDNHKGHLHGDESSKDLQERSHSDEQGEEHGDEHEEGVISLDEEARSMIELKTEVVKHEKIGGHLKVYGKIAKDAESNSYVTVNEEGRVESIKVNLGAIVNEGDLLLTVYKDDGTVREIKSEMHGAVLSIFVKPGDRVDPLTSMLSIIDVDTLRATIDIYEKDFQLVEVGQEVVLATAAFPNKEFYGEVVFISPQVDEHTQAIKIRVDVENPDHLLRLGMFVSGELIYASDKKALAVPMAAVQQLNGEDIVFVAEDGNDLKLKEVVLGRITNDYVEIIKGLSEGEAVVTQGSFYLKSEQAKEAFGDGHNH